MSELSLAALEARLKLNTRAGRILKARLSEGLTIQAISLREGITPERTWYLLLREVFRARRVLRPWREALREAAGAEFLRAIFSELRLDDQRSALPDPSVAILKALDEVQLGRHKLIAFLRGRRWAELRALWKLPSFGALNQCSSETVSEHIERLVCERRVVRVPTSPSGFVYSLPEKAKEVTQKRRKLDAPLSPPGLERISFYARRVA